MSRSDLDQGTILTLIDRAFAAVLEPDRWTEFLRLLADAVGGASIGFSLRHPRAGDPGRTVFWDVDPAYRERYAEECYSIDPFAAHARRVEPGSCGVRSGEAIETRALLRSPFYNEWMRPQGWLPDPMIGAVLDKDDEGEPSGLGLFRPKGAREYGDTEVELVRVLVPHLQRAVRLANHVEGTASILDATGAMLDRSPIGVVVLDRRGRVVRVNRRAQAIIDSNDGITVRDRELTLTTPPASRLRKLIAAALEASQGRWSGVGASDLAVAGTSVAAIRPSGRRPLQIAVAPVRRSIEDVWGSGAAVVVFVADPDDVPLPDARSLRDLYDLTPAEAELALRLARGDRLREAADRLGVSIDTVRSHLKQVFQKTNTHRQVDLVHLLLRSGFLAD